MLIYYYGAKELMDNDAYMTSSWEMVRKRGRQGGIEG